VKRFVLDASVALAWVADPSMDPYAEQVGREIASGARALVPALWPLEVGNGLLTVERRRALTAAETDQGFLDMERFLASHGEIDAAAPDLRQIGSVARAYQLTTYDAAYLELARREKVPLATLDSRLQAAAAKAGVERLR
jgi:predicted nucleic acid-binding protein